MKYLYHRASLSFIIFSVGLVSCATTEMVNMWRNDQYHGGPLHSVLIVGMTKNTTVRRSYEDGFTSELRKIGVKAVPSYRFFSKEEYSSQIFHKREITEMAKFGGFDGVIMSRLVSIDNRLRYVPGYSMVVPGYYGGPFGQAWEGWYNEVYEPGYYVKDRIARVETQVWLAKGRGQLLWTGLSDTVDPRSVGKTSRELAKIVIGQLKKVNLL